MEVEKIRASVLNCGMLRRDCGSSALALTKDWKLGLTMFPLIGIVLLVAKIISLFDK